MCTVLVPYSLCCGICRVDVILIGSFGVLLTVLSDHPFLSLLLSTVACPCCCSGRCRSTCSVVSCCYLFVAVVAM